MRYESPGKEGRMARRGRSIEEELRPVVDRFIVQLARILEKHATADLKRRVLEEVRGRIAGQSTRRTTRAPVRCYFPGCKNIAAPRFGMFCAAEHKNLPAATKAKYRAQRLAAGK
jgi:hypothetical protein